MHHDYYYYNKEQLLSAPKIPMVVMAGDLASAQDYEAALARSPAMTPWG